MAALSQLSYGPLAVSKCNREVEIVGPRDAPPLIVSRGVQTKAHLVRGEPLDREKEAAIELVAVRSERIDLGRGVEAANQPALGAAIRIAAKNDDIAVAVRPLALHAV